MYKKNKNVVGFFRGLPTENNNIPIREEHENFISLLLDSSLITRVRFTTYSCKIVRCGDYLQVYYYSFKQEKKTTDLEQLEIKNLDINDLYCKDDKKISDMSKTENKIEHRNIVRTKLNCQRLAKSNSKDWKSFITLTYADNMQDLKQAKKDLYYFCKNVQKKKKDFKYIAIPEFQKRGAIHFHLLTNLSIEDKNIITQQKDNKKYYDVKYWKKGFTSFETINGDVKKIIGYISKYMTKECDDRLFSIRRFTTSQNLVKPITEYIDIDIEEQRNYFIKLLNDKECIYTNNYLDSTENDVIFREYKLKD